MRQKLEVYFEFARLKTNWRTEAFAGLTTFITMAYIIVVNPSILAKAGLPIAAVTVATCISAAFGSILMGVIARYPLALAPGMGLNAYFSYVVVMKMHVPWQTALGAVFLSGVIFLLLTATGLRQAILHSIPHELYASVAGGIGLFIAFIGLKDAGIIVADPGTTVALGHLTTPTAAVSLLGLLIIAALQSRGIRGYMLIGILITAAVAWSVGLSHFTPGHFSLHDLGGTAFKLDIPAALSLKGGIGLSVVEIIFVFLFVDMFDNVGTLVAVTRRAGLVAPDGTIPRLNRILTADSASMLVGALAGTSPVTSYIESAAGVAAGGRTGLTSVVVGVLFLATLVFAPVVQAIPAAATAPALILVGALMMGALAEVEWSDPGQGIPAFLTVVITPLSYSITNGLAFGITSYAVLKLIRGQARLSDWLVFLLAALCVLRFIYLA
jgi:adenine/guanine/hypoxanthine permease